MSYKKLKDTSTAFDEDGQSDEPIVLLDNDRKTKGKANQPTDISQKSNNQKIKSNSTIDTDLIHSVAPVIPAYHPSNLTRTNFADSYPPSSNNKNGVSALSFNIKNRKEALANKKSNKNNKSYYQDNHNTNKQDKHRNTHAMNNKKSYSKRNDNIASKPIKNGHRMIDASFGSLPTDLGYYKYFDKSKNNISKNNQISPNKSSFLMSIQVDNNEEESHDFGNLSNMNIIKELEMFDDLPDSDSNFSTTGSFNNIISAINETKNMKAGVKRTGLDKGKTSFTGASSLFTQPEEIAAATRNYRTKSFRNSVIDRSTHSSMDNSITSQLSYNSRYIPSILNESVLNEKFLSSSPDSFTQGKQPKRRSTLLSPHTSKSRSNFSFSDISKDLLNVQKDSPNDNPFLDNLIIVPDVDNKSNVAGNQITSPLVPIIEIQERATNTSPSFTHDLDRENVETKGDNLEQVTFKPKRNLNLHENTKGNSSILSQYLMPSLIVFAENEKSIASNQIDPFAESFHNSSHNYSFYSVDTGIIKAVSFNQLLFEKRGGIVDYLSNITYSHLSDYIEQSHSPKSSSSQPTFWIDITDPTLSDINTLKNSFGIHDSTFKDIFKNDPDLAMSEANENQDVLFFPTLAGQSTERCDIYTHYIVFSTSAYTIGKHTHFGYDDKVSLKKTKKVNALDSIFNSIKNKISNINNGASMYYKDLDDVTDSEVDEIDEYAITTSEQLDPSLIWVIVFDSFVISIHSKRLEVTTAMFSKLESIYLPIRSDRTNGSLFKREKKHKFPPSNFEEKSSINMFGTESTFIYERNELVDTPLILNKQSDFDPISIIYLLSASIIRGLRHHMISLQQYADDLETFVLVEYGFFSDVTPTTIPFDQQVQKRKNKKTIYDKIDTMDPSLRYRALERKKQIDLAHHARLTHNKNSKYSSLTSLSNDNPFSENEQTKNELDKKTSTSHNGASPVALISDECNSPERKDTCEYPNSNVNKTPKYEFHLLKKDQSPSSLSLHSMTDSISSSAPLRPKHYSHESSFDYSDTSSSSSESSSPVRNNFNNCNYIRINKENDGIQKKILTYVLKLLGFDRNIYEINEGLDINVLRGWWSLRSNSKSKNRNYIPHEAKSYLDHQHTGVASRVNNKVEGPLIENDVIQCMYCGANIIPDKYQVEVIRRVNNGSLDENFELLKSIRRRHFLTRRKKFTMMNIQYHRRKLMSIFKISRTKPTLIKKVNHLLFLSFNGEININEDKEKIVELEQENKTLSTLRYWFTNLDERCKALNEDLIAVEKDINRSNSELFCELDLEYNLSAKNLDDASRNITCILTLFMPITFITSLLGMNCKIPGQEGKTLFFFYEYSIAFIISVILFTRYAVKNHWFG